MIWLLIWFAHPNTVIYRQPRTLAECQIVGRRLLHIDRSSRAMCVHDRPPVNGVLNPEVKDVIP